MTPVLMETGVGAVPSPEAGRLSHASDLSLDAVLFTQFVRGLKGKLGTRPGHPLITYSHFYSLIYGKNRQMRQIRSLCDPKM